MVDVQEQLSRGWGHPPKAKAQHYFVPDRGTLFREPDGTVVSLCRLWRVDPNKWWGPMDLQDQPLSTGDDSYLQYPVCAKRAVKFGYKG